MLKLAITVFFRHLDWNPQFFWSFRNHFSLWQKNDWRRQH